MGKAVARPCMGDVTSFLLIHACAHSTNACFVCQTLCWVLRYHSEQPDMDPRLLLGPVPQQMEAQALLKERRF